MPTLYIYCLLYLASLAVISRRFFRLPPRSVRLTRTGPCEGDRIDHAAHNLVEGKELVSIHSLSFVSVHAVRELASRCLLIGRVVAIFVAIVNRRV